MALKIKDWATAEGQQNAVPLAHDSREQKNEQPTYLHLQSAAILVIVAVLIRRDGFGYTWGSLCEIRSGQGVPPMWADSSARLAMMANINRYL